MQNFIPEHATTEEKAVTGTPASPLECKQRCCLPSMKQNRVLGEAGGCRIPTGRCLVSQESVDGSSRVQKEGVGWLFRDDSSV